MPSFVPIPAIQARGPAHLDAPVILRLLVEYDLHSQKEPEQRDLRPAVIGRGERPEHAASEGHRQKQLVGQVFADGNPGVQIPAGLLGDSLGDVLRTHGALAESGEDLRDVFALDGGDERVPGTERVLDRPWTARAAIPAQGRRERVDLPKRHGRRHVGHERPRTTGENVAALEELEPLETTRWMNRGRPRPAAGRMEPVTLERDRDPRAHASEQRHEGVLEKVDGRRHRIVRSPFEP